MFIVAGKGCASALAWKGEDKPVTIRLELITGAVGHDGFIHVCTVFLTQNLVPTKSFAHACRRRGSQDVEVSLEIEVDNQPERYNLSASLSAVLGLKQATRAYVLHTLWTYIKLHRLQVSCLDPRLLEKQSSCKALPVCVLLLPNATRSTSVFVGHNAYQAGCCYS